MKKNIRLNQKRQGLWQAMDAALPLTIIANPAVQMMCKEHQDQASSHLELLERELKQRHKNSQGGD